MLKEVRQASHLLETQDNTPGMETFNDYHNQVHSLDFLKSKIIFNNKDINVLHEMHQFYKLITTIVGLIHG